MLELRNLALPIIWDLLENNKTPVVCVEWHIILYRIFSEVFLLTNPLKKGQTLMRAVH